MPTTDGEQKTDHLAQLIDLEYMALLMIDTMEHTLESTIEITDQIDWYYIPDQQANMLLFSAYHLLKLIKDVSTQFRGDSRQ